MAITLVEQVESGTAANVASLATGTLSAAPSSGDLVVIAASTEGSRGFDWSGTSFTEDVFVNDGTGVRIAFASLIAGASEPTSYTVTLDSGTQEITTSLWVFSLGGGSGAFHNSASGVGDATSTGVTTGTVAAADRDDCVLLGCSSIADDVNFSGGWDDTCDFGGTFTGGGVSRDGVYETGSSTDVNTEWAHEIATAKGTMTFTSSLDGAATGNTLAAIAVYLGSADAGGSGPRLYHSLARGTNRALARGIA